MSNLNIKIHDYLIPTIHTTDNLVLHVNVAYGRSVCKYHSFTVGISLIGKDGDCTKTSILRLSNVKLAKKLMGLIQAYLTDAGMGTDITVSEIRVLSDFITYTLEKLEVKKLTNWRY
jgi:hypothetical protein